MNRESQAAQIISDLFSASVLHHGLLAQPPRTFLYAWEQNALDWLREWRAAGGEGPICAWTGSYLRHNGPPPWPRDKLWAA